MLRRKTTSIFDRILDAGGLGAGFSVVLAMLIIVPDVILRYAFNQPIAWSTQVCSYTLLGATFMGIAYLQREKGHVIMDFVTSAMPPRVRALVRCITLALCMLVMAVLAYFSVMIAIDYTRRQVVTTHTLEVPKGILIALLALGFFFTMFEFARQSYGNLKIWRSLGRKEIPAEEKAKTERIT